MAGAAIYGTAIGVEAEFGGDMRATAASLDRALILFLEDVSREAGPDVAAAYATNLIETLVGFTADGAELEEDGCLREAPSGAAR